MQATREYQNMAVLTKGTVDYILFIKANVDLDINENECPGHTDMCLPTSSRSYSRTPPSNSPLGSSSSASPCFSSGGGTLTRALRSTRTSSISGECSKHYRAQSLLVEGESVFVGGFSAWFIAFETTTISPFLFLPPPPFWPVPPDYGQPILATPSSFSPARQLADGGAVGEPRKWRVQERAALVPFVASRICEIGEAAGNK